VLVEMTDREYAPFLEQTVATFADALVRSMDKTPEEAREIARGHLAELLPKGLTTTGHHFRTIVRDDERVGVLWFAEQFDEPPRRVFIYDIAVDAGQRGRGVGTEAIRDLEAEARALGAEEVRLSVFGYNTGAIRLYERLGFECIEQGSAGMRMAKKIAV
jgi:ribosomal protein S18 acetylase RimI-like enzyme